MEGEGGGGAGAGGLYDGEARCVRQWLCFLFGGQRAWERFLGVCLGVRLCGWGGCDGMRQTLFECMEALYGRFMSLNFPSLGYLKR